MDQFVLTAKASSTSVRPVTGKAGNCVEVLDFKQPVDRITPAQMRILRSVHEDFARRLAPSLSATLQCGISASLADVTQKSYDEFLQGLRPATCLAILSLAPGEGGALMELNPELVFSMLEVLLGGRGTNSTGLDRAPTRVEQNLLEDIIRVVLRDLRDSWHALAELELAILAIEPIDQHRPIISPREGVVVVALELALGEDIRGTLHLALPLLVLKRLKVSPEPRRPAAEAKPVQQDRMLQLIRSATTELDVQLQKTTISLREVLRLREGSVLALDHPVTGTVDGVLNHCTKFHGHVVSNRQKRVFQIEGFALTD
jgi:flagellar motor switch protein FliM